MADRDADEEDVDEHDIFEIDDFTTASEWERFISQIEEILGPNGWKLENNDGQKSRSNSRMHLFSTHEVQSESFAKLQTKQENGDEWVMKQKLAKIESFEFILMHQKLHEMQTTSTTSSVDSYPKALLDCMNIQYNFPQRAHAVSQWYGVKDFLLLTPKDRNKIISSLSQINLIWSSVGIALSNLQCTLPMFFQVKEIDRQLYYGMCIGNGFRTAYEMIQLSYVPHNCNHVQGMIETFMSKIGVPAATSITVSVRFTYVINNWFEDFCYVNAEPNYLRLDEPFNLHTMPFGPLKDPIKELNLAAIWPCLASDVFVDDAHFSDLKVEQAHQWRLKIRCPDATLSFLHGHLWKFLKLCKNERSKTTAQIIRSLSADNNEEELSGDVSHVLDRLAEPVPSLSSPLSSVVTTATRKVIKTSLTNPPISEELLNIIFELLFPDAQKTEEEAWVVQGKLDDEQKNYECEAIRSKDKYRHIKSAPLESLTQMLAVCICMLNYSHGGVDAVAHMWHEFILELRYRFENNILIPRLAQTFPNLNYCLIHQKLQMLNCCILRRQQKNIEISRHTSERSEESQSTNQTTAVSHKDFNKTLSSTETSTTNASLVNRDSSWNELLANVEQNTGGSTAQTSDVSDTSSDDDDEFYEAREDFNATEDDVIVDDDVNREPQGVLEESSMKLLVTGKMLCVPLTQETPPLTEDMLIEQQNALTELGTSKEAARMRAQMQSASLLSDMESFKAANPGCILEDFVRWYSPNDWLPGPQTHEEREEVEKLRKQQKQQEKRDLTGTDGWESSLDDNEITDLSTKTPEWSNEGRLSLRMRAPGNIWQEVWNTAKPIAARLQRRLFDDTKEAEKVLHFLTNLTPSDVAMHLFPVISHAALHTIDLQEDSLITTNLLEEIMKDTAKLHSPSRDDIPILDRIVEQLHTVEVAILRIKSLRLKLSEENSPGNDEDEEKEKFIRALLEKNDVIIKGGAKSRFGKLITQLLEHQKVEEDASHIPPLKVDQDHIRTRELSKDSKMPKAFNREYILRTTVSKPSSNSRPSPQRLYTIMTKNKGFRMAGSFTEDTNFL